MALRLEAGDRNRQYFFHDELCAQLRLQLRQFLMRINAFHRHEPASATAQQTGDDEITMTFDQPQRAITPGQAVVLYDGDNVVGGGWII